MSSHDRPHIPIMVDEVLSCLEGTKLRVFFDGTVGAGGHAQAILQAHPEIVHYIGCDKDPEALDIAKKNLTEWENKVTLVQGSFGDLDAHLEALSMYSVDGFFLIWGSPLWH